MQTLRWHSFKVSYKWGTWLRFTWYSFRVSRRSRRGHNWTTAEVSVLDIISLSDNILIKQLFQNRYTHKSECRCAQGLNRAVQGLLWGWHTSLRLHKSCPVLCQEPWDSWILLKMLCKWSFIVSPLKLLLYGKVKNNPGYLRTRGWKVLGLPTPNHSLVTREQNKQVSAGSGKGKVSTSVRTRDGRAWLRAGGTTLGLEKVANKSLVKEQNST